MLFIVKFRTGGTFAFPAGLFCIPDRNASMSAAKSFISTPCVRYWRYNITMRMKERVVRFRSFWIFPLLAVLLLEATSRIEAPTDSAGFVWMFAAGLVFWTLLEYALHRFLFHIQIPIRNPRLRDIVNASHLAHHASPRDPNKLLVHTGYALIISALIYGSAAAAAGSLFKAAEFMAGLWAGFLYYEAVHY